MCSWALNVTPSAPTISWLRCREAEAMRSLLFSPTRSGVGTSRAAVYSSRRVSVRSTSAISGVRPAAARQLQSAPAGATPWRTGGSNPFRGRRHFGKGRVVRWGGDALGAAACCPFGDGGQGAGDHGGGVRRRVPEREIAVGHLNNQIRAGDGL